VKIKTYKIQINGRVQGVGFRPFIFNTAKNHKLNGSVSNNSKGVLIYINATKNASILFLNNVLSNHPDVAVIISHIIEEVAIKKFNNFSIVLSSTKEQINIPLTPDFAVCEDCKEEIKDKKNKRYQYAFTTCVHCGPRYAITTKFPFERENTTIENFVMCTSCKSEYKKPSNKRFHSQTNSCSECGISIQLVDNSGNLLETNQQKIIKTVAQLISEGKIIAIKNTNGYLLCCSAINSDVIQKLRIRKQRPNKPFAVLYPSIREVRKGFNLTATEGIELQSKVAPIVILSNTTTTKITTKSIAPNLNQTGVMLPSSALMELIMHNCKTPIIATSGNIHGSPIISNSFEAEKKLKNIADYFLHHNLEIEFPQDDSVIKYVNDKKIILRRSRGMAPNYLNNNHTNATSVLAMGAHLKSTFTFVPNQHTYVSQYFGNLDSYEVSERYKTTLEKYINVFNSKPKTILIDKHPEYQSSVLGTAFSKIWKTELIEIQHHKAHFASVLGEHDLFTTKTPPEDGDQGKILGVIWDGTGLGDDYSIWGGEFFIYENKKIERLTHFEYFDWIANDKMAKEPRLSLLSLLNEEDSDLIKGKFTKTEWNVYTKLLKKNGLKTSSVGRLFDAVASALNIIDTNTFEAEAAMLLENCANSSNNNDCIDLLEYKEYDKIPSKLIMQIIIKAYKIDGVSKAFIARSFIYTLAKNIIKIAKRNDIKIIACSGGVFQNSLLISMLIDLAKKENNVIKLNRKLSANDENISFGQLMYYQNIKN